MAAFPAVRVGAPILLRAVIHAIVEARIFDVVAAANIPTFVRKDALKMVMFDIPLPAEYYR